jgi:hypothetical protein
MQKSPHQGLLLRHVNKDEVTGIATLLSVITDSLQFTQQLCSRWSSKSQISFKLKLVYTGSSIYIYTSKSCWNPSSNVLEFHQSQHDHFIACIVVEHYASAIFVPLCFHSRKGKLGVQLKKFLFNFFSVCLCNCKSLKLHIWASVCILVHSQFLDCYFISEIEMFVRELYHIE